MNLSAQTAVIEPAKLRDYLQSLDHPDGRAKARYLALLGYELEFFSARGETVAVVSVPATAVRAADSHELLTVRTFRAS